MKLTQKTQKRVNLGTTGTGKWSPSMKHPHFVDRPTENQTTSMKTGNFMDNIQKYMKIKEGFVLRQMCGENIVAGEGLQHINFNKLISLNESAAYLWKELVDKEFTQQEMAELLIKRYGIDEQLAMIDSEKLMASWSEIGLTE